MKSKAKQLMKIKQIEMQSRLADRGIQSFDYEVIEAKIHEHEGNIDEASKDLDVRYIDLANLVDKRIILRNICLGYRTSLIDKAEMVIRHKLDNDSLPAATFVLKTLGKDRGYVERTEQRREVINEERKVIDLSRLSEDQLRDLQELLIRAENKTIDGEAKVIND